MLRTFTNYEEFLAILKTFDVSQNPFQSEAFYRIYFHENPQQNYSFFDISNKDGERIGIVPFEVQKSSTFYRIYRFIGYRKFNYQQYICSSENTQAVHSEVYKYFQAQRFACIVNYYDINDHTELFRVLSEDNCVKKVIMLYECPFVILGNSFDEFFRRCIKSSKNRSELRKFEKKLSQIGKVSLISISDNTSFDKYKQYISQVFRIYSERFKNVYNTSEFAKPENRNYYISLIETLAINKKCVLSLLTIDDCVISFVLCICNETTLIDWIPAFDPAFSKYNIGTLHYKILFEQLCSSGKFKYFDFSKGTSVYKRRWAKEKTKNYQLFVHYNSNFISTIRMFTNQNIYAFKSYLRANGILEKIKNAIGMCHQIGSGEKHYKYHINFNYNEVYKNENTYFSYAKIVNAPLEDRKHLLDELYEGKSIVYFCIDSKSAEIKFSAKEKDAI